MPNTIEMIEEFKSFIPYVMTLNDLDEAHWNSSLEEGKWSLKDVISHIMLWDKYFYEEAIEKIKQKKPLTVRHLNFDEFNANAREYAKTQTKEGIVQQFVDYRTKIIHDISGLSEEEYVQEYLDGDQNKFSIREYLIGFVPHDEHHKKQIENYVQRNS
ncbi:hypothetical protein BVG16_27325 [Paenibacillus selenitireducens]|uniref:DinB-like domain-containing protein n=2 Tax=Paenibacillus selenitireducens TaxID=1324314 RepID=A0A1T2X1P9_9BACL|nr:hypothetical protein BVG16_27325 [Paenibacillus selenitireducens]